MYLPKSKYQVKESGGQFMYADTKKIYIGKYIEFSDGLLITGARLNQEGKGREIIPLVKELDKSAQVPYKGIYNKKQEDIHEFHVDVKKVISRQPLPLPKDYKKGNFRRYFAIRRNSKANYFEIDKKTFDSLKGQSDEYDWHLYGVGSLEWFLGENSTSSNSMSLKIKSNQFTYIGTLFSNLQEYYKPSSYKPTIIDKTKPQKQNIAKSKHQTEIEKSTKHRDAQRKERLRKRADKNYTPPIRFNELSREPMDSIINKKVSIKKHIDKYLPPKTSGGSSSGGSSGGGGGGY